ncbi:hypothetical protein [Blastochloris tepida]|uniref:hypothetical protein n=1 Tax=Blastochloris tepida TaxID=2233851 RepID=UPI0011AEB5FC|nr:hypothetical protein [Blastochloris tepida]
MIEPEKPPSSLVVLEAVLLMMISKSMADPEDIADALEDAADALAFDHQTAEANHVYRTAKSIRAAGRKETKLTRLAIVSP